MADFLEFPDITSEIKGCMVPGRLKLTDEYVIFKNAKTGKVEQFSGSDIDVVNWQRLAGAWGVRIFLENGHLVRFGGFSDKDQEKLAKYFSKNYNQDMLERELSVRGWNWGTAKFYGEILGFEVEKQLSFEVPLQSVSQCIAGKNEVTLEFHQNDDVPVHLIEMRYHIPSSELAGDDPVEKFQQKVLQNASVISATGEAIVQFNEIQCLTPRGRYDIKLFPTFFQLHGKTFDYKIPVSTVLRLFLLPHKDQRQMFFVLSLDPPIKQGQTRYHYLVLLFNQEDETSIELSMSEEEVKTKYEGKLQKEMDGPVYEIFSEVLHVVLNRKITRPGSFIGASRTSAVSCSYKAAAGYLYPLERGFIYIHKPPLHLRFDEISAVNFARSSAGGRTFDLEIETRTGMVHAFSSIEKGEYGKLFDFITSKKLRVKNSGKLDKPSFKEDYGDSDTEVTHDAYKNRLQAEAAEQSEDDDSSEDEDFKPPTEEMSDVAEEYDSNVSTSSSSSDSDSSQSDEAKREEKRRKRREKKERRLKSVSEKPRKKRKPKKERDENKPKRAMSAYFLWLNENRENIKSDNPGLSVTEISKKAGEMWRELKDKSEWEAKAAEEKQKYEEAMKEYKASGGGAKASTGKKSKSSTKSSPMKSPAKIKSKEYISDSGSSNDGSSDDDKPLKAAPKKDDSDVEMKSDKEDSDSPAALGSDADSD